jgi:hypothetical protein
MTAFDRTILFVWTWFIAVVLIDLACQYFGWPLPTVKSPKEWVLRLFGLYDPSIRGRSIAINHAFKIITSIIVMILAAIAVKPPLIDLF